MAVTRFLIDTYLDWVAGEGVPVLEDFGFDLLAVETAAWPRMGGGARGAYVHVKGRGDFVNAYVCELAPGGQTEPQQHLFEEVVYVLSGRGSTTIRTAAGARHSFEWGTGSLFALPLNTGYQHFNTSGRDPARFAAVTSLPLVLNAFHNERFVFDNPWDFSDRHGEERFFRGEGEFLPVRPGRHQWQTNFVPDLRRFQLQAWEQRGIGSSNIKFILADGTMHPHVRAGGWRLQEGPPPRARLPHLPGHRAGLLAAVVRGRAGVSADRLAARLPLRTARPDVPPALQHGPLPLPLPGRGVREHSLPLRQRQEGAVRRRGRQGRGPGWPTDRIRGRGPAGPRDLRGRARDARRGSRPAAAGGLGTGRGPPPRGGRRARVAVRHDASE